MYETKSEPFKKILAAVLCFIVACVVLSGVTFAPNQGEPVEEVSKPIKVARTFSPPPLKRRPLQTLNLLPHPSLRSRKYNLTHKQSWC